MKLCEGQVCAIFPSLNFFFVFCCFVFFLGGGGGGGGLGFPFIFSKIDLAQNKMKQQTSSPQIKDEAVQRAKTRHFLIFDLGGSRFSIYFVQDRSCTD